MTVPRVGVVIPTRNRAGVLPQLLAALDAQDYQGTFETVVVDDASTDLTAEMLAGWAGEERRVIRLERPSGSYAARNAGWRVSSAEIVVFTDDDCLPGPGWLTALVAGFDPRMVGVQGCTRAEPGEITPFTHQVDQRRPGPPYRTCNIAYRRTILERLGGFDDSLRWYADNIFGLRARRDGPIGWAPDAIVRHPPRPREYREVSDWLARFDADARHRQALHELGVERITPPRSALPILLWVLRPLVKQSLFHLRYLLHEPRAYIRGIVPMLQEKQALLAALHRYYRRPDPPPQSLLPLPDHPLVTVIVVTRDRSQLLAGTLDALHAQTWRRHEIIVVDHAGTLQLPVGDVRVIRAPGITLGAARQRGLEAAGGHVVAFTDDDCLPRADWLATLVQELQWNRTWRGVQGRTVAAPGPIGSHAVRVSRPGSLYQTSNIAYRRDALRAAGGFDVDFIGWFEDTALAARVLRNGPIGFASNAVVVHRAMPRRALGRSDWQALLHDERLLARRYPDFYLRTRGPGPLVTIVVRWVLGSPLKTLLRELQRAVDDPEGFGLLVRSLLEERRTLLRVLLDERRSGYR